MAGPTFGAVGSAVTGTGTTVSVPVPAGVAAGSFIVVVLFTQNATTINGFGTTGLQHAPNSPQNSRAAGGGTFNLNVLYKVATGADSGTYDVTQSASDFHEGAAARYEGVNTVSPWDSTTSAGSTASGTTSPAVSLTTTQPNTMLFHAAGSFAGGTWTPSTGFTQRFGTGSPNGITFFSDDPQAAAGGTGTVQATVTGSSEMAAWLGAMAPAGAGATDPGYYPGLPPYLYQMISSRDNLTTDQTVTILGTVGMVGAGVVADVPATILAPETSTGAGALTNAAVMSGGTTVIGAGTLNPLVTQGAIDTITGSSGLTELMTELATVVSTGIGSLTDVATLKATVSMVGVGTLTASSGQSANLTGAGTLSATPTIIAGSVLTGSSSLSAAMVQTATTTLTAAGNVAALNVQRALVAMLGAGTLVASPGASGAAGEIWGVAT